MSLPLSDPSGGVSLAIALAIGLAFGWTLERAGLGSARKLIGQFYLTDLTVFKVMFSAIVTAMLGTFWLNWLGVLDLPRVYVPETFVLPQLAGGLIFGIGFALAGLCPGTSCVAAATGRGDGVAVMAGMLTGVLVTGLGFGSIQRFYESGARGTLTLPELLHVSPGTVVFLIVAVALGGFRIAEHLERRGGGRPASSRRRPAILAGMAVVLGALAIVARGSDAAVDPGARLGAIELATWIKDRHPDLQIFDVRSVRDFDEYHIPTAAHASIDAIVADRVPPEATIVVYADTPEHARAAWTTLRGRGYRHLYYAPGGVDAWLDEVMNPALPAGASPDARAAFAKIREVSLYFGGVPRVDAPGSPRSTATAQQVRRRGC